MDVTEQAAHDLENAEGTANGDARKDTQLSSGEHASSLQLDHGTPDVLDNFDAPRDEGAAFVNEQQPAWSPFPERELTDAITVGGMSNGATPTSSAVNGYHGGPSKEDPCQSSAEIPTPQPQMRPSKLKYQMRMTLRGHKKGVAAVKFSPDGQWIASCSADCTIKIWHAITGALEHTLDGHMAGISTIAWSPDSKIIASGSDDKNIRLWDIDSGRARPTQFTGHSNYVYSVAFSPKGNMLASGSYDEALFLWDVRTARVMRSLPAHSDPVSGVDFVRDGSLVASGSHDGVTRIWDAGSGMCLKTLVHADNKQVTSVKFSPNGRYVLTASLDSCLRLWDYVENRCVKTYQGHKNVKFSINACFGTYASDNSHDDCARWAFVAVGDEEGSIYLWDVSTKDILQVLPGHEGSVFGVDVNNLSGDIATCGEDGAVRVWTQGRRHKHTD